MIGLVVNTISGLSVKELPEEELNSGIENDEEKKYGIVQAFKLLVKNKYYMMICGTYILQAVIQCYDWCRYLLLYMGS